MLVAFTIVPFRPQRSTASMFADRPESARLDVTTECVEARVHNAAGALGVGCAEVIGSLHGIQLVALIAESLERPASDEPALPTHLLGTVRGVGSRWITVAADPGLVEHDPSDETRHADETDETDETDDDHVRSCAAARSSGRS